MQHRALLRIVAAAGVLGALAAPSQAPAQSTADFPERRPGYWEVKIVTEKPAGAPTLDSQVCIDAATDRELIEFGLGMSKDSCERFDIKRTGKNVVIDSQCAFGPVKATSRTTMSGDFQSTYTIRIEGTSEGVPLPGAGKGPQETLIVQTARWVGAACPAGMKPGDFTLPGGMKVNIKQARQLKKLLPQIQIR